MLCWLSIKNLVLVKECTIGFQQGFNVLTGESGAGKSVVLAALSLVLGQKQTSCQIRHGEESATIEAAFDQIPCALYDLLDAAAIPYDDEEHLIIRRQLSASGKSRSFINNSLVPLAFLKTIAPLLAQISAQHAAVELFHPSYQQQLVDSFASLEEPLREFREVHEELRTCKKEIHAIQTNQAAHARMIDTAMRELEEITSVNLKEGEDEELFARFTEKSKELELVGGLHESSELLEKTASALSKVRASLERLARQSPTKGQSLLDRACGAAAELSELSYELTSLQQNAESSPDELEALDRRLKDIERLKKKYGASVAEILAYKEIQAETLRTLENQDVRLEELQETCARLQKEEDLQAGKISARRLQAAEALAKRVTEELAELNMQGGLFEISLTPRPRSSQGDEAAQFFLTPNKGLSRIAIEEAASGGELSRIVLAIQCALVEKTGPLLLVFDEIDANIGGQTAKIIGQKLARLSLDRQVIAITHFAQVASSAHHHFRIWKEEALQSTVSHIEALSNAKREEEFTRMQGGGLVKQVVNEELLSCLCAHPITHIFFRPFS